MIISDNGFDVEPGLAAVLGDVAALSGEALDTSCALVEPVHFLARLARASTIMRTELLERQGIDPAEFCGYLYATVLEDDRETGVPLGVGADVMSPATMEMLGDFERRATALEAAGGGESLFLLVVMEHVPEARSLLSAVVGSDDDLDHFLDRLRRHSRPVEPPGELFDPGTGALQMDSFDASGRRLLDVLREETAALGYRKVTALHLLYALVGIGNGVLQSAIQFQGIDPLRAVHSALALQLRRPAGRRTDLQDLGRETLHASVRLILEKAAAMAARESAATGQTHIARAALAPDRGVITEWLTGRKLDVGGLRDYLEHAEVGDGEDTDDRLTPPEKIGDRLHERIFGQDHAIARVLPWIKRLRYGFPRERGPAAVLLFLGPSGSGKTELAKELARTVYGSDEHLLMLEMGQFATKESTNMFIGAPPGYVGYGEGKLTNGLRDKPNAVVLFDEVEKAHEDVWPALLRFLDEGLIDDPAGPTRDGRSCVVVLTSNLGADRLAELAKAAPEGSCADDRIDETTESAIRTEVLKYLKRPEIYNRVDDKIVFRPFTEPTYRRLVERQVEVEGAKFAVRGTRVELMPDVYDWLTGQALASRLEGARCVPRLANRYLVAPVIDLLTEGGPPPAKVIVSLRGNGTCVERA